jgi:hypothetical protein
MAGRRDAGLHRPTTKVPLPPHDNVYGWGEAIKTGSGQRNLDPPAHPHPTALLAGSKDGPPCHGEAGHVLQKKFPAHGDHKRGPAHSRPCSKTQHAMLGLGDVDSAVGVPNHPPSQKNVRCTSKLRVQVSKDPVLGRGTRCQLCICEHPAAGAGRGPSGSACLPSTTRGREWGPGCEALRAMGTTFRCTGQPHAGVMDNADQHVHDEQTFLTITTGCRAVDRGRRERARLRGRARAGMSCRTHCHVSHAFEANAPAPPPPTSSGSVIPGCHVCHLTSLYRLLHSQRLWLELQSSPAISPNPTVPPLQTRTTIYYWYICNSLGR